MRESSIVGWNKHSGSTIIETFGGCAPLHPPYDLYTIYNRFQHTFFAITPAMTKQGAFPKRAVGCNNT
ncbi:MAG: hypothetical protein ACLPSL_10175 [Smithella sp.]